MAVASSKKKIKWTHKKGAAEGYNKSIAQKYTSYTAAGRTISGLSIVLSSGMAVATWSNPSNTAKVETQWYYKINTTGGGKWVAASRDYQDVGTSTTDSYNVPQDAIAVDVYVKPTAKTFVYQWQTYVKKVESHDYYVKKGDKKKKKTASRKYYVYTTNKETRYYYNGSASHVAGGVATDNAATPTAPAAPVLSLGTDGKVTVELDSDEGTALKVHVGVYMDGAWGNHLGGKSYGPYGSGIVDVSNVFTAVRGHAYRVDARQENTVLGVYSAYSAFSEILEMPPSTPANLSVSSLSANAFMASWDKVDYTGDAFELRWASRPDDMTLDEPPVGVESVSVSGGATTYTSTLAAGTWYFCVRATSGEGKSDFTAPARITLGLKPAPPTLGNLPAYVPQGGEVQLSWTYNNTDGSSQMGYEVARKVGTGEWAKVAEGSTGLSTLVVPLAGIGADSSVKLRVRTLGATGEWSEWSESPSIVIDAPLMVTLGVDDPPTIPLGMGLFASADVRLWHLLVTSDEAAEMTMPDGTAGVLPVGSVAFEGTFQAGEDGFDPREMAVELDFADSSFVRGVSYTARLDAISAHGLTDDDSATFAPQWDAGAPMPQAFVPDPGDDYIAHIFPECRDLGAEPIGTDESGNDVFPLVEGVELSVYRIDYDGQALLVADGVENNGRAEVIDEHPNFGYCTYRIAARAADGSIGFVDEECYVDCESVVLDFDTGLRSYAPGDAWDGSGRIEMPYDIEVDEKYSPDVELAEFIGNDDPTLYAGTQLGRTASVSTRVVATDDADAIERIRMLAGLRERCYYRDPTGLGFWAWAVPTLKWDGPDVVGASFAISRIMGDYGGDVGYTEA